MSVNPRRPGRKGAGSVLASEQRLPCRSSCPIRGSACSAPKSVPRITPRGDGLPRQRYFSQAKIRFQSFFILMTNQPLDLASSYSAWVKVPMGLLGSPCADIRVARRRAAPASPARPRRPPECTPASAGRQWNCRMPPGGGGPGRVCYAHSLVVATKAPLTPPKEQHSASCRVPAAVVGSRDVAGPESCRSRRRRETA